MIAVAMQRGLEEEGVIVIGPAPSFRKALRLLNAAADLDGAVLDMNLGDEKVFPPAVRPPKWVAAHPAFRRRSTGSPNCEQATPQQEFAGTLAQNGSSVRHSGAMLADAGPFIRRGAWLHTHSPSRDVLRR